jgi:glycogen operon protein
MWWHISGREMSNGDWNDGFTMPFGMILRGDMILDRDVDGSRISDATFVILFNPTDADVVCKLPDLEKYGGSAWEVVDVADGSILTNSQLDVNRVELRRHTMTALQLQP